MRGALSCGLHMRLRAGCACQPPGPLTPQQLMPLLPSSLRSNLPGHGTMQPAIVGFSGLTPPGAAGWRDLRPGRPAPTAAARSPLQKRQPPARADRRPRACLLPPRAHLLPPRAPLL